MVRCRGEKLPLCLCLASLLMLPAVCVSTADAPEHPALAEDAIGVYDRSTPDRLLQFYIQAQERKDIDMYRETLHDDYMFFMDSRSAARMGIPEESAWLSRAQDIAAQDRLFSDPSIESIQIQMRPMTEWHPYRTMIAADSTGSETAGRLEIAVDPTMLIGTLEPGGNTRVYTFDRNTLCITVVPDPRTPGSWVILRIEEELEAD